MCFSASASFVAGTSLSAFGAATLRNTLSGAERPFAMIPLLFGIQQITEGIIWVTFTQEASALKQAMTYVYSVFSHVFWPVYVPFVMALLEPVQWRRQVIFAFEAAGLAVGMYLLYFLVTEPVVAEVIGGHIVYVSPHFFIVPVMVFYLAATCLSCFFSSHRFVNVFGVLALIAFIVAYVVHVRALVSIWCFFAAILSFLIYLHLRFRRLGGVFPTSRVAPADQSSGP